MNSIIDDIHDLLDLPRPDAGPEREKLFAQLDPLVTQVQNQFGLDFVARFTNLYAELYASNDLREFRLGFVVGARLMMEVLW